ncbi:MAG TPA: hypothetical protein VIB79_20165 [Candidatus Binatia bacterium]
MKTIPIIRNTAGRKPSSPYKQTTTPLCRNDAKSVQCPASAVRELLHDIANQLTLLNLASFDLHTSDVDASGEGHTKAIRVIDAAIEQTTSLFKMLSETLKAAENETRRAKKKPAPKDKTKPANVYSISPYLRR